MTSKAVTAGLLIIGDEILSGRTEDKNTSYLARWLEQKGVDLLEVRIVSDNEAQIGAALLALKTNYDYVFTTGGIGPTHDDITAESVARALDVPLIQHPEAMARLEAHYGTGEFTEARQRMARVPAGGLLIDNPVSVAPGFQVENIFVMAGVPKIMQAMLEGLGDRINGGTVTYSDRLTFYIAESKLAMHLADIQRAHPDVSVGSYPFFAFEGKKAGAEVVVRSKHEGKTASVMEALRQLAVAENIPVE